MNRPGLVFAVLASLAGGVPAWAETPAAPPAVTEALRTLLPEAQPGSVRPAAVDGLWEVTFGAKVYYLTADGAYLMGGPLVDLRSRTNLTEQTARRERKRLLAGIPEQDMVVFAPEKAKHTVTVFTDIDCGYCRKLHAQVADYNALGIAVRYLAFPRAGLTSESAAKARAVWCAKDRQTAMTRAKSDQDVPPAAADCKDPVARQYGLGVEMDITGTPALVLDNGRLLSGYLAPEALARTLAGPAN